MFQGNLAAVSNRAGWTLDAEICDPETDELVDLSGAAILLHLTAPDQPHQALVTAGTASGEIAITGIGTFTVSIPAARMATLQAGEHRVFLRATIAGADYQLLADGSLPVVEGGPR
jgi:hypothetical protein